MSRKQTLTKTIKLDGRLVRGADLHFEIQPPTGYHLIAGVVMPNTGTVRHLDILDNHVCVRVVAARNLTALYLHAVFELVA